MSIKLNDTFIKNFITEEDYKAIGAEVSAAYRMVAERSGAADRGNLQGGYRSGHRHEIYFIPSAQKRPEDSP